MSTKLVFSIAGVYKLGFIANQTPIGENENLVGSFSEFYENCSEIALTPLIVMVVPSAAAAAAQSSVFCCEVVTSWGSCSGRSDTGPRNVITCAGQPLCLELT